MSANNELAILKTIKGWKAVVRDVDTGSGLLIGEYDSLETAIAEANKYADECADEGHPIEYGLSIEHHP